MNTDEFLKILDDDPPGTGHSFFDPFVTDGVDPNSDCLESMIEFALETHGQEEREDGSPTEWALASMKCLKKFRKNQRFRASATEEVRKKALELIDDWDDFLAR